MRRSVTDVRFVNCRAGLCADRCDGAALQHVRSQEGRKEALIRALTARTKMKGEAVGKRDQIMFICVQQLSIMSS